MTITSSLPSELWLYIFELVTYVPYLLNTDPPNAFAYPRQWSDEEIQEVNLRSMVVKRRLMLVCKRWCALGSPLLYQAIVIRNSSTIRRLASTLKLISSTVCKLNDSSGPGMWTKRLDICLQKNDKPLLDGTVDLEDIGILIRSFSNLEILVVKDKMNRSLFFKLFDIFATSGSQKLRKLDVQLQHGVIGDHYASKLPYYYLIGTQRELRFLSCNTSLLEIAESDICMDNIEFLDVRSTLRGPFKVNARNSNSTTLLPMHMVWNTHPRTTGAVLKNIGHWQSSIGVRLTVLEVGCLSPWENKNQKDGFLEYMQIVAEACPNLSELIIRMSLYWKTLNTSFIPSVKKLGIRFSHGFPPVAKARWKRFCIELIPLVENTHSINVVRILDAGPTSNDTQNHMGVLKMLRDASKMLKSMRGVRLEDNNGRVFYDETQKEGASCDKTSLI